MRHPVGRWVAVVTLAALAAAGCSVGEASTPANPRPSAANGTLSPAPTGVAAVTSVASARAELDSLTSEFAMNRGSDVSIAAVDTTTGTSLQYGASSGMLTASAVKVNILIALLLQHQDAVTSLDDDDDALATKMIQNSDNDAAIALFDEVGGVAGMAKVNKRLQLQNTTIGTGGYFGETETSAADQLILLTALTSSDSPLDAASRAYALDLMRNVDSDQNWGVTVSADNPSAAAVKNGWLPVDDDDGRWAVTSMGVVTADGHQILMAVFTQHQDAEQYGIDYIEQASKLVAAGVTAAR